MMPGARRGWLLAVEGIDGVGKSTFVDLLARELRRGGHRVGRWREPVDRALGRRAQAVGARDAWSSALLFTLDRARAASRLDAALERTDVVITDRSFYSTLAYQGSALAPGAARALARLQRRVTRPPDRVLWLRLDVPTALARVTARGAARSPLERRRTLERVDRAYRRLAARRGWITLDADQEPAALVREAVGRLRRTIARPPRG